MIIALTSRRAKLLSEEFVQGIVRKEYIARCSGNFPEYVSAFPGHAWASLIPDSPSISEEITVEQPLLTVDRQMGLNIVHPEGKVRRQRQFSSDAELTV